MKVILTQTVTGLGEAGTIKEVADGYARNFLLPKKLAVAATRGSMKQAEAQAEQFARKAGKVRDEQQKSAAALADKTVMIRARAGSENRLYGSVTSADVAEAIKSQLGFDVDRRRIELGEAIHRLGTYQATADFGGGVVATFNVEVAQEVPGASGTRDKARAAEKGSAEQTSAAPAPASDSLAGAAQEPDNTSGELTGEPASQQPAEEAAEANPS